MTRAITPLLDWADIKASYFKIDASPKLNLLQIEIQGAVE